MMKRWKCLALAAVLTCPATLFCLVLAGCGFPAPESAVEQQASDSCRDDVNRTYNAQNRAYLSERPETDTPYSAATPPPLPSDGLSERYAYENDISACLKRSAAVPVNGAPN